MAIDLLIQFKVFCPAGKAWHSINQDEVGIEKLTQQIILFVANFS